MTRVRMMLCGGMILVGILCGCASPETRRDKFLAKGKDLLEKKDYTRAMLEFRNASGAVPQDAEPYYYMGVANMSTGDLQTALLSLRKAIELNPSHAAAKLRLAQLMTLGDKPIVEEAEKNVRDLMQIGPATPEMLNTLAVTELRLGKTDDAVHTLEQALAKAPSDLTSSLLLARTRLIQNDAKGAEEALTKLRDASPNTPDPHLILGRFYMSQKRMEEAERSTQRALQLNPKSTVGLRDLAVVQNAVGRKKEAEETFKRLTELGVERYIPIYGLFLFAEGRRDDAVREFERTAKQYPDSRVIRTQLITLYQAVGRNSAAAKLLDESLQKNPRDTDALLQRGQMLSTAGKYGEAEEDFNKLIQQKPDFAPARYAMAKLHSLRGASLRYRQELTKALELDPFLLMVRLELAGSLIAAKNDKSALEVLDKAPDAQKQSPALLAQRNWALWAVGNLPEMRKGIDAGLARERSLELLVQDGMWKLASNNAAGARVALEEALNINPGDIRALNALKQVFVMQRQPGMAVQKAKEYAAKQPNSAPVQEFLGYLLWASGDRSAARAAFTTAKSVNPKFERADLALVQLDAMDSKWGDAATKLSALVAENPQNVTARLWLGNIENLRGNTSAALEQFRKVVEASPGNPQALNNYAYLLAEQANKYDEALTYAQKAQELAPDNAQYADTLGWILYRKGLYPSAVRQLQRATNFAKQDPVLKYHLAMAYAKSGDTKRSRATYEEAVKLNANVPEAKAAKELLGVTN
jgi:tetratricopeptide (TPR) repeat protein